MVWTEAANLDANLERVFHQEKPARTDLKKFTGFRRTPSTASPSAALDNSGAAATRLALSRVDALHFAKIGLAELLASPPELFFGHLLHPIDDLAVQALCNGNVRHPGRGRRSMPVLFAWGEPDHIAGANLFDRPAFSLRPAASGRHDERLA
jgi:hypothetical protein